MVEDAEPRPQEPRRAPGEEAAGRTSEDWLPIVYEELRRMARGQLGREGAAQTLQTTALVHEAYLRLLGGNSEWNSRGHFFSAAAQAMRRILIDRARARRAEKRGGSLERTPFELVDSARIEEHPEELIALDAALEKLEAIDARKSQVVMLRYFAGLSLDETGAALGISKTTVKEDWSFARAWLFRAIR